MQPPFPAPVTEWRNETYDAIDPKNPELSMAGKTIVITGGGTGIGRETVRAFGIAGASSIHILGRTRASLTETKEIVEKELPHVAVSIHVADVTDVTAVEKSASEIGKWDVLVANAGYFSEKKTVQHVDLAEWWLGFEVT